MTLPDLLNHLTNFAIAHYNLQQKYKESCGDRIYSPLEAYHEGRSKAYDHAAYLVREMMNNNNLPC